MQVEFAALLAQTLQSEDVRAAESALETLRPSPDFLPALMSVFCDSFLPDPVRSAALLYLTLMVQHLWDTEIPPDSKTALLLGVPDILNAAPRFHRSVRSFSQTIVKVAFFAADEWPNILDVTTQLLQTGEIESVWIGLILSLSIFGEFNVEEADDRLTAFSESFLTLFAEVFIQFESLEILELAFHCASRLIRAPPFLEGSPVVLPIIQKSLVVGEYAESDDYFRFASSALKFSWKFMRNCAPGFDVADGYIKVIFNLFPLALPTKVRLGLVHLLAEILRMPLTEEMSA
jgi:hypothetical protein